MTPVFFLCGFLAFFAGVWVGILCLVSRLSGWRELAPRYPVAAEPAGERLTWCSAGLGGASFRSCLNLNLSHDGLYMVPTRAFRLFMPSILIPWRDVRYSGVKSFWLFKFSCYRLGGEDGPVLSLWPKNGERFLPYLSDEDRRDHAAGRPFEGSPIDRRIWLLAAAAGAAGFVAALLAGKR